MNELQTSDTARETSEQPTYFVVTMTTRFYSMAEVAELAPAQLREHVARSKELHRSGALLMAGAFLDHPDQPVTTMGILTSREQAEDFAHRDPFVVSGQVESWEIRPWANIFAT
ncbi:YciI family protein [Rathayibacter soli]|uniref:YciI family protein n=1 Tax=Rathayibacter soli TaxID=3144168 RepID=UPI0027E4CA13|nr:YciI family protein [Glaciibacter superstes]